MAHLIDGKALSMQLRENVAQQVQLIKDKHNLTPGLAVVLVGDNDASQVYVRNKIIQTSNAGMNSFHSKLDAAVSEDELLTLINRLS